MANPPHSENTTPETGSESESELDNSAAERLKSAVEKGAETNPEAIDLEHFLPYRLTRLSHRISRGIANGYQQQYQISIPEWRILAVVARFPDSNASMLLDYTAMDKVAVHRAVQQLLQRELINRRANPDDKRQQLLKLTESGHQLHARISRQALDYEDRLLSRLEDKEIKRLYRLLSKLEQYL